MAVDLVANYFKLYMNLPHGPDVICLMEALPSEEADAHTELDPLTGRAVQRRVSGGNQFEWDSQLHRRTYNTLCKNLKTAFGRYDFCVGLL